MPPMGTLLGIASAALGIGTSVAWFRAIQQVTIHRGRAPYFMAWGLAFALGVAAWFHDPGLLGGTAAVLGLLPSFLFLFLAVFSAQADNTPAVAVGGSMLAFQAPDDSGVVFESASLTGRPYLLKFFRGHW